MQYLLVGHVLIIKFSKKYSHHRGFLKLQCNVQVLFYDLAEKLKVTPHLSKKLRTGGNSIITHPQSHPIRK